MKGSNARARDRAAAQLSAAVTSFALNVQPEDIFGDLRGSAEVALARHVAMYLCHIAFELSLARVAIAFGRDRSTVAHACHTIEDRRDDLAFENWIGALEMVLRDTPIVDADELVRAAS
jgi:chromosomal replication initiation ATPase DnaA